MGRECAAPWLRGGVFSSLCPPRLVRMHNPIRKQERIQTGNLRHTEHPHPPKKKPHPSELSYLHQIHAPRHQRHFFVLENVVLLSDTARKKEKKVIVQTGGGGGKKNHFCALCLGVELVFLTQEFKDLTLHLCFVGIRYP